MSQLLQLRDAMVAAIKAALPGVDVAGHLGRFDEGELARFLTAPPAVRVAILDIEEGQAVSDEGADYAVTVGVYVVTKDGDAKLSREESSIAAVETILRLCDRTRFGCKFAKLSGQASARNLYNTKALERGVALWAVAHRQPVRIAPRPDAAGGPLKALFLGFAPDVGPDHVADYVRIAGEPEGARP